MNTQDYSDKAGGYFGNVRREIEPLLPPLFSPNSSPHSSSQTARVLEVGCGSGATLQWLQQQGRCSHTVGIELFEAAAATARGRVDELHVGNAESMIDGLFEPAAFDLVLCLDVLEHMTDPWAFVAHVQRVLKPGGTLIASIPNVRHLRVVLPLLLAGRWRYEESGILDRTHLRFFTQGSALALVSPPGMQVTQWQRRLPPVLSKSGVANLVTLGLLRDLFTMGYLIAARKDLQTA